jgi:MoaA/NifB/PqqE/SkfB family radical SAM enzyme
MCQLKCGHCYADSGPQGTHGTMELADWLRAIGELAAAGVDRICVIGGEPTLHPDLGAIVEHALASRMQVEVYTNLVHVSDEQWRTFERRCVSLATSFYSSDADEEDQHRAAGARRYRTRSAQRRVSAAATDRTPRRPGCYENTSASRAPRRVRQGRALGGRSDRC